MNIDTLLVMLSLTGIAVFWAHHTRVSARARNYTLDYLSQQGLQLLDQSVVLVGLRVSLYRGMPCFLRKFRFEFSRKGDRRYYGWVTLRAWQVEHTELQPFVEE